MHDDPRRGRDDRGADEELVRALRSLGERYEPDLASISHRISISHRNRQAEPELIQRTSTVRPDRLRPSWITRPVMLPIAAVILVAGGILALMPGHSPDDGSAATAIAQAGAVTSGSTQRPNPSATGKPDAVPSSQLGPAVSATEKSPRPSNTSGADQGTAPVGPQPTIDIWRVWSRVPTARTLSMNGRYDWIAVGARSDRKQVRAAQSAAHPMITVDQPNNANVVYGPFRLNWTHGVPEDHRDNDGSWMRADGETGWTMTLQPSSTTVRRLQLYLGSSNLKASVVVSGRDFATHRFDLHESGNTPRAEIVEIGVPRTSHVVYLHFSGTATAAKNANFYLAGLTLRTNNQETARTS